MHQWENRKKTKGKGEEGNRIDQMGGNFTDHIFVAKLSLPKISSRCPLLVTPALACVLLRLPWLVVVLGSKDTLETSRCILEGGL